MIFLLHGKSNHGGDNINFTMIVVSEQYYVLLIDS